MIEAFIDFHALNKICPCCAQTLVGTKLGELFHSNGDYSGDLLTEKQVEVLNNMCPAANKLGHDSYGNLIQFGTYFENLLELATESGRFTYTRICNHALYDLIANSALPAGGVSDDQINPLLKEAGYTGIDELYKYYVDYLNKKLNSSYTDLTQFEDGDIISYLSLDYYPGFFSPETNTKVLAFFCRFKCILKDDSLNNLTNNFCKAIGEMPWEDSINQEIIPDICKLTCLNQSNILLFSIPNATSVKFYNDAFVITVMMPGGTSLNSLIPSFTLSTGATAKVGDVTQVSGTTANDFSNGVKYLVTSVDGLSTSTWTVYVATPR